MTACNLGKSMTDAQDGKTPTDTIREYVEACRVGSVDRLRGIFESSALMTGFFQGDFYIGSPDLFFDEIRDNPSPSESGAEYSGEIATVELFGDIANITLKEQGYLGCNLTNLFHLARIDGDWKIVSKTYTDE